MLAAAVAVEAWWMQRRRVEVAGRAQSSGPITSAPPCNHVRRGLRVLRKFAQFGETFMTGSV